MATTTPRTRTGCQSCRVRHLKCDERKPACSRCVKSGIECIRGFNIRFRHGANPSVANTKGSNPGKCDYDFATDQPWCRTSHNQLSFIDETQELINVYERDSENEDIVVTPHDWAGSSRSAPVSSTTTSSSAQQKTHVRAYSLGSLPGRMSSNQSDRFTDSPKRRKVDSPLSFSSFQDSPPIQSSSLTPPSPDQHQQPLTTTHHSPILIEHQVQLDQVSSVPDNVLHSDLLHGVDALASLDPVTSLPDDFVADFSTVSDLSPAISRIYLETPVWPLQEREEAKLMRYYIESIAPLFDICDQDRHFTLTVPQRAALCPTLLNAIFATSAKHMSRVGDFDPFVSDRYHTECLKHLIPMLGDTAAIMDENLLAATVMLRYLEEIDVPLAGPDAQSHLLGTHIFLSAQESSTVMGGLRQAAFWVGLRQEIYMAFVNQRTIMPALSHCNIDRTFEPAHDCVWANRIIVLCADILRYCFGGDDSPQSTTTYTTLASHVEAWNTYKPPSFTPLFHKPPAAQRVFPEIWLASDATVTGLQHYHLARILLTAHNPRIPRLGPGQRQALRQMDEEIKADVRVLCGMALSNKKSPPNFVTACMAIALAGERFEQRAEQEALMSVLLKTEFEHGWHTRAAQFHLKESWGWVDLRSDVGSEGIANTA